MLSNEDIFYIKGIHEIIMSYKKDMDRVIRKRVTMRQHNSSMKHIYRIYGARMGINLMYLSRTF